MSSDSPPRFHVTTPRGRGAVATVAVLGGDLDSSLLAHFRPAFDLPDGKLPLRRIVFGRWRGNDGGTGEELVVCRLSPSRVDIHCHGGLAAVEAIAADLTAQGLVRVADASEWLALVSPACSPLAREAQIALAHAPTDRTAEILIDQWHGALDRELVAIIGLVQADRERAREAVAVLLERSRYGLHLTTPFRVALFGSPNVGKSSLMNMLVGFERAIVFDQPGTTRDILSARTALDGWPVEFFDTAGLRDANDVIEAAGVALARRQLRDLDLGIMVAEATSPWSAAQQEWFELVESPLVLYNKCDLGEPLPDGRPPGLAVSALTKAGKDVILEAIVRRLVPSPPLRTSGVDDGVPFLPRHVAGLRAAAVAIEAGRLAEAIAAIERCIST